MIILIIMIVLSLLIKLIYNPKLDETNTGKILLWFGKPENRKNIELWQKK